MWAPVQKQGTPNFPSVSTVLGAAGLSPVKPTRFSPIQPASHLQLRCITPPILHICTARTSPQTPTRTAAARPSDPQGSELAIKASGGGLDTSLVDVGSRG